MQYHVHQSSAANYLQVWQLICIVGKRKMIKMNSLYSQNKEVRNLVGTESQKANQMVTVPPTQLSDFLYVCGNKVKVSGLLYFLSVF